MISDILIMAGAAGRLWAARRHVRANPPPQLYAHWKDVGKGWDVERWPNFVPAEFACNCGGRHCTYSYYHDCDFLDRLQAMRTAVGRGFVINSGHRCPYWNAAIGGAARSTHKQIAADISLRGHDPAKLFAEARKAGFGGIGFGATFLHVDTRSSPTLWGYGQGSRKTWERYGVEFTEDGKRVRAVPAPAKG